MTNCCARVPLDNQLYKEYHDKERGVPIHDEHKLFEMLTLEWAQAGLSWLTVVKKRENYRIAFDKFDPSKVSKYNEDKVQELLKNEWIIRNKLKVRSTIENAKVFLEIQKEFGSFDAYIRNFTSGLPITNKIKSHDEIPAKTWLSDQISKDLKKRWMSFVWSTIIYAFMQAIWVVNDHEISCFRYKQV